MTIGWALGGAFIGFIIGGMFGGDSGMLPGLLTGAVGGSLWARVNALKARVEQAEGLLADLRVSRTVPRAEPDWRPAETLSEASQAVPDTARQPEAALFDFSVGAMAPLPPPPPPVRTPQSADVSATLDLRTATTPPSAVAPGPLRPDPAGPGTPQRFFETIKRWFTEGNVPVKVGMLVLFAGVAALLKYAADEGWLTLPIELRLAGVGLAAVAALAFGWRQRNERRAFALSLQGGAIGVLLLVVFAAFRLYSLLPAGVAFALMLVLVVGIGVLAVLQDALALAVLGLLAGFAAPILLSTGEGNHVVLFAYYALLNLAILAVAWLRPWRVLNLLGFFFTFAIATVWGVLRYRPDLFASTEPFLVFYFALYLAIPIPYALRSGADPSKAIDGPLVFGTPLISFVLQAGLLDGERLPIALSALGTAMIYLVLAFALRKRVRLLGESFAVLAIGFATLAIPLAFSARVTGCVFALEGAALIWLGLRQGRRLPQISGLLLQLAAAGAMVIGFFGYHETAPIFANARFIAALLIAGAAFISAWLYLRAGRLTWLAGVLYLWGLLWWFGALVAEIERGVPTRWMPAALLAATALTSWLAAEAERRWKQPLLALTTTIGLWAGIPLCAAITSYGQPLASWALAAHVAYAVFGLRALACLRESGMVGAAHAGWVWTWIVVFALALEALARSLGLGGGWRHAAVALPLIVIHVLTLRAPQLVAVPVGERFEATRQPLLLSQGALLALIFIIGLASSGDSMPLPFMPLLNPLEITGIGILLVLAMALRDTGLLATQRPLIVSAAGFALITMATLRAVHHLGGVAWNDALLDASLAQTSLAVVWSVLGVAGWVIGSRRSQRGLWLAGAVLMAIVLLKLLLVDRQHLGNLFGIASFIAYGLLCTLIGYLAPAPPREAARTEGATP